MQHAACHMPRAAASSPIEAAYEITSETTLHTLAAQGGNVWHVACGRHGVVCFDVGAKT